MTAPTATETTLQTQTQKSEQVVVDQAPEHVCSETKQPLWEILPSGAERYLQPHGQCVQCRSWFHTDAMHLHTTHTMPIRLRGGWCRRCWDIPISKKDPIAKIKYEGG